MKVAYFEICLRLEAYVEKQLGEDYFVSVAPSDAEYDTFEENGFAYELLVIHAKEKTYSVEENSEIFWDLIKQIEKNRTIRNVYERYKQALLKSSPQLFQEEIKVYNDLEPQHIIILATSVLIVTVLWKCFF